MATHNFSIKKAIGFGFRVFAKHWGLFLVMALFISFIYLVTSALIVGLIFMISPGNASFGALYLTQPLPMPLMLLVILFHVGLFLIDEFYYYHLINAGFIIADDKKPDASNFFLFKAPRFVTYLLARWGYYLKIFIGFILLVIPGIYLAIRYYFTGYSIVKDTFRTVSEDANHAQKITEGVRGKLFWFVFLITILLGAFNLVLLPILISPLTSSFSEGTTTSLNMSLWFIISAFLAPISQLMMIHVYKQLSTQP